MEIYDGITPLFQYLNKPDHIGNSSTQGSIGVTQCCGARLHSISSPHQCQKGLSFFLVDNKNKIESETKSQLLGRKWINTFHTDYIVEYKEVVLDDQYSLLIGETLPK